MALDDLDSIIPYPIIDPRNEEELADEALRYMYDASESRLNDFTDHNPASVLNRSLSRLGSELLWYVNKLPRALVIAYLRLAKVERSLGQRAKATLRVTLSSVFTTPFTLPAGFEVSTNDSYRASEVLRFVTTQILVIPAGNTFGEVLAECTTIGDVGNVPRNSLTDFDVPYAGLSEITNPEPAYGGSNTETLASVEERALSAIRRRGTVVTQRDYEDAAEDVLGAGSRAIAEPLVGGDGVSYQIGSVHVFGVNPDKSLPGPAECLEVERKLQSQVPLGTSVYFSPAILKPVDLSIIAQIANGENPNAVAESVYQALLEFINPSTYSTSTHLVIKDLEFVVRSVFGVRRCNSVLIDNFGADVLLNNAHTLPSIRSLYLELIDESQAVYRFGWGEGVYD